MLLELLTLLSIIKLNIETVLLILQVLKVFI